MENQFNELVKKFENLLDALEGINELNEYVDGELQFRRCTCGCYVPPLARLFDGVKLVGDRQFIKNWSAFEKRIADLEFLRPSASRRIIWGNHERFDYTTGSGKITISLLQSIDSVEVTVAVGKPECWIEGKSKSRVIDGAVRYGWTVTLLDGEKPSSNNQVYDYFANFIFSAESIFTNKKAGALFSSDEMCNEIKVRYGIVDTSEQEGSVSQYIKNCVLEVLYSHHSHGLAFIDAKGWERSRSSTNCF